MALLAAGILAAVCAVRLPGQVAGGSWEWRTYAADLRGTRYAPLSQIHAGNFSQLQIAWRFTTASLGPAPDFNMQSTPLMVGGRLYTTAGSRRAVVALDARTGELLWLYRLDEGERARAAPWKGTGRGLAYWTDGRGDERIYFVTVGYQLVGLDARSGRPIERFGSRGVVDLKQGLDQPYDPMADIGLSPPPLVAGDVVLVGSGHRDGAAPLSRRNTKGAVRAYDARSGRRLWIFHTIPRGDEPGASSWENGAAEFTGNTGAWAPFSVDEELGLAYLPVETPTSDYYGGHRPGDNLFAESLVAVELKTGRRVWHYQFVHHGIWDYDLPCAPILVDITVSGRSVKAIAQPTKQAFLYVLDRRTGKPVWPILERAVAQSGVPGEKTSPTQPFPTKPPAYDRQGVGVEDLIDFTPELHAKAVEILSKYESGPLFTPPVLRQDGGPLGLLMMPYVDGASNWPGGSYDPETHVAYLYSQTAAGPIALVPGVRNRTDVDYISLGADYSMRAAVDGLPLVKPPWGRITAVDLDEGRILWQVAHGETPDAVRNHPALRGLSIPRTGRPGRLGTLTTKTLVIAGEAGFVTTPSGLRGAMLRAYDKRDGRNVGEVYTTAPATGAPMTYLLDGQQYLVVAIGGGSVPSELVAYRLPSPDASRQRADNAPASARHLAGRSVRDGVFHAEQAEGGKNTYIALCAKCHGETMTGGDQAPGLKGTEFTDRWSGGTLGELFDRIQVSMPLDAPGSLTQRQVAELIAVLLRESRFPAGQVPLPTERSALGGIRVESLP